MKRGFTLIELLAVIVILAIIALIAVPIVLNIINDSKESSGLRSAEFYLDAVEYTIADAFLYHGGLPDNTYPITKDGDICKIELDNQSNCPKTGNVSNTLKVEVNGKKPTGGSITIESGNISGVKIILDEKTIAKNSEGKLVYYSTSCTIERQNEGKYSIGDIVSCGEEQFYVMENQDNDETPTTIDMLTKYSLDVGNKVCELIATPLENPTGIQKKYLFSDGCSYGITAFSTTAYWNTGNYSPEGDSEYRYVYDQNSIIYTYIENYVKYLKDNGVKEVSGKLISYEQVIKLGVKGDEGWQTNCSSAPEWLCSGATYWTGSLVEDGLNIWFMPLYPESADGLGYASATSGSVRPVITISPNNIK